MLILLLACVDAAPDSKATECTLVTWYTDADGDAHGDSTAPHDSCDAEPGWVASSDDCDDTMPAVYPGAAESCNNVDDDCDGSIDEDAVDMVTWYADVDGDGHGDAAASQTSCEAPEGAVASSDDCDDLTSSVYSGAPELCNSLDDDCDGSIDEDAVDAPTWYADMDGDGYGDAGAARAGCDGAVGEVAEGTDCDDGDAGVCPGCIELEGTSADEDCDGRTDEIYACQDGTGDHDTISAAIEAAPAEGAVVEICPGTYYESIAMTDRVIELRGQTGDPEDVVIDATDLGIAVAIDATTTTTSYLLDGVTLIGGGEGAIRAYTSGVVEMAHFVIRDTTIDSGLVVSLYGSLLTFRDCEVHDNHVGSSSTNGAGLIVLYRYDENGSSMKRCDVHHNEGFWYAANTPLVVNSNNIYRSNSLTESVIRMDGASDAGNSLLFNNTLVDNDVTGGVVIEPMNTDIGRDAGNFRSNVLCGNVVEDVIHFDEGGWANCGFCDENEDRSCTDTEALENCAQPELAYNWFCEVEAELCQGSWCSEIITASNTNELGVPLGLSSTTDPPYSLPSGSSAIDGGDPSMEYLDQDGTTNDPGRYGGPHAFE